jgi:hypothetical protein
MDVQFDLWGRMIIVRGIHFDNIKTVAKFRDNALHSIEKDGAEWSGMAQTLQNGGKTPSTFRMAWRCKIDGSENAEFTPIEDEDIAKSRKTYECTIATDLRPCVIRNRPDFVRGAHDHSSEFENFPENAHSLETQDLEGLVNGRSLAITSSGRMGFVPDTTEVGDIVCVLYGSLVPYILRRCPGIPSHFTIVGACYIHERMDGQVIEDLENGLLEEMFKIV